MIEDSGIFLVNKSEGVTSHDVIHKIKKKFNIKKIGHAGTLDPLATGVMVVLINQATKISNFLLFNDKCYEIEMNLFSETDSGDITGNVVKSEKFKKITKKQVKLIMEKYNGYMYDQYPPIYSAIKVKGKKLYEYAREKKDVLIKPKTVTIISCLLINFNSKKGIIKFKVWCSKGTYIRSLVKDIAKDLNTIASVSFLRRIASGMFNISETKLIDELDKSDLIDMYTGLLKNKQTIVEYHQVKDIFQGKTINLLGTNAPIVFIVDSKKTVIAIYKRVANHLYNCQRGLWDPIIFQNLTEAEREM